MDESSIGVEWTSGETLAVTLVDQDLNKNTLTDEDMVLSNSFNATIPSLQVGSPVSLSNDSLFADSAMKVQAFNKIGYLTDPGTALATDGKSRYTQLTFNGTTIADMRALADGSSFVFANYDVSSATGTVEGIALVDASGTALYAETATTLEKGLVQITTTIAASGAANLVEADTLRMNFTTASGLYGATDAIIYADIFTFGDKVNNAIYRLLLEETGDNTATFVGEVEFVMLNQINNNLLSTYTSITTISDEIDIIVHEDLTDEDSPIINYLI
jgi:hypothetical protein